MPDIRIGEGSDVRTSREWNSSVTQAQLPSARRSYTIELLRASLSWLPEPLISSATWSLWE